MRRGLRVALVTDTFAPQLNGVTRTLDRLVAALEADGGTVHVETVTDPAAEQDPRIHRTRSIPFWAYPEMRISTPGAGAMAERLEAFQPDLVHLTTPFGVGIAGMLAARTLGLPTVTSYHTSYPQYLHHYGLRVLDRIAWPWLRWFHNASRRTYAPSRWIASELTRNGVERVALWSRGVDTARFDPSNRSETLRRRLGVPSGGALVAYVGRIAPEKGIDVALDAMRRLAVRWGDRVRFALAGDGPAVAGARLRAPDGTTFTGSLAGEDLGAFYASSDVLLFPSTTDTFGNVVLESLASGTPVVAADHGLAAELVDHGAVLTFPGGDAAGLEAQVSRLLHDDALADRLRRRGRAVALGRDWNAVWSALFSDYRRVIADSAQDRRAA